MAKEPMTKSELTRTVAKRAGLTITDTKKLFQTVSDVLVENTKRGIDTKLVGFGNFELVTRAARKGRNPQTGKSIKIPAHRALHFKPGRELREAAYKELK